MYNVTNNPTVTDEKEKNPQRAMLTKEEDAFGTRGALQCCDGLP